MPCIPILILVIFTLPAMSGCAPTTGSWEWQPINGLALVREKEEVIRNCEIRADEDRGDIFRAELENARPYGGWGNFDFELCMEQNGWQQIFKAKE